MAQAGGLARADIDALARIVAETADSGEALGAVTALVLARLGARGLTVFRYLAASGEVERIHSSDPAAYPVGGRKRIVDYPLNQTVLARGEVYVAQDRDGILVTYQDAERIFSLGVTSIMNVPVRHAGSNIGAINVMGTAGQFGTVAEADGRLLAALLAPLVQGWRG